MMKRLQTNIDTKYAITTHPTEVYGEPLFDVHIQRLPKIDGIAYIRNRGETDIVDDLKGLIGCIVSIENHGDGFIDRDGNLYYFEEVQDAPRV